jgi:hypothetical protein
MSDMRATERLLEVIAERARLVDDGELLTQQGITEIRQAADELRRRGDTLVRRDDLRVVIAAANHGRQFGSGGDTDYTGFEAALARIDSSLGGVV